MGSHVQLFSGTFCLGKARGGTNRGAKTCKLTFGRYNAKLCQELGITIGSSGLVTSPLSRAVRPNSGSDRVVFMPSFQLENDHER